MAKRQQIAVRLDDETKAALEKAAAAEQRPVSSMVAKIIVDWLKRRRGKK